jgi:hypothetical protein
MVLSMFSDASCAHPTACQTLARPRTSETGVWSTDLELQTAQGERSAFVVKVGHGLGDAVLQRRECCGRQEGMRSLTALARGAGGAPMPHRGWRPGTSWPPCTGSRSWRSSWPPPPRAGLSVGPQCARPNKGRGGHVRLEAACLLLELLVNLCFPRHKARSATLVRSDTDRQARLQRDTHRLVDRANLLLNLFTRPPRTSARRRAHKHTHATPCARSSNVRSRSCVSCSS